MILFVSHRSSDVELRESSFVRELIESEPESEFFSVDVRGTGDSQPDTCGENQFLVPYGSDYFYAAQSIMWGTSIPAQRAFDILRVIDWLKGQGRTEIHLAAQDAGTIPTTLAAVVSTQVTQVTFKGALRSFSEIAESEKYDWPLSSFIPSVLKDFDLPDCYKALADKKLKIIEPSGSLIQTDSHPLSTN